MDNIVTCRQNVTFDQEYYLAGGSPALLHHRRDAEWAAGAALDFHREGGDVAACRRELVHSCDIFERRDVLAHQDLMALKQL